VITGNDDDLLAQYAIVQSVWKALQVSATGIAVNDWIKLRLFCYRIQRPSNRTEEFFAQPNSLAFIPTKGVI
jgi:hypothetical protein